MSGDKLLKPWVIISAREALALRDYVWHETIDENDLHRAVTAITNQLGWIAEHADQSNTERRKLVDDATARDND